MKPTFCCWCQAPIKVRDNFNERKQKAVCSTGCRDAETLFLMHFNDEEIHRRAHYRALTEGDDDGET